MKNEEFASALLTFLQTFILLFIIIVFSLLSEEISLKMNSIGQPVAVASSSFFTLHSSLDYCSQPRVRL